MYNMIFGQNALAPALLEILALTKADIGRFRDAFVSNGQIAIYTRLGGGNRECYCKEGIEHDCYTENIQLLQNHSLYVSDKDDDFDNTYATFWFRIPEEYAVFLAPFDRQFKPNEYWENNTRAAFLEKKPRHVGFAYFVPGAILFVGSCLLLLASWRAGLVLSYPERLWQIHVPAMLGLVAMLVGFMGIFWVNWKER